MSGLGAARLAVSVVCGLIAMLAVPVAASADPVRGLLDNVGGTVGGVVGGLTGSGAGAEGGGGATGGGAGGSSTADSPSGRVPTAGTPPGYTPPAHGTNPHGSGTVGVVDLTPDDAEPLPYDPGGGSEDVVVGRSYGEQRADGSYHGHVTILSLLGNEIVGVDTNEGETDTGPVGPLNDALDDVCSSSGNQLCLNVLDVRSETNGSGSSNSFELVGADVGTEGNSISASAGRSSGEISDDGSCQTARGSSSLADASVLGAVSAEAISSSSESRACADGSRSQSNDSRVLTLNEEGVPLPAPGCEDGTPNTVLDLGIVSIVCNADDSSNGGGVQLQSPYGTREGLTVFALPILGEVVKGTAGASESHAAAPSQAATEGPEDETTGPGGPGGGPGQPGEPSRGGPGGPDGPGGPGEPGEPGAPTVGPPDEELPFTGADMPVLVGIGLGISGAGLLVMALADRRRLGSA